MSEQKENDTRKSQKISREKYSGAASMSEDKESFGIESPPSKFAKSDLVGKEKDSPEFFLKEAEDFINQMPPNDKESCKKIWESFKMAITLMYAKIGINLMSDHSMKVFTSFAIDVSLPSSELKDELFLYAERPFRAQHLYYRGSAKKREVDNLIKNVKVLIEQFEKFDVNHIKAKLESYKEDGKLNDAFLKEFEYLILYDEEHEDTIFGRTFKFAHKADKNGLCDVETDYIDEY